MKVKGFLFLPFCFLNFLLATDQSPWIDQIYQPVVTLAAGYQHFDSIHEGKKWRAYPGRDPFIDGSIFLALDPDYSFEIESSITRSHAHPLAFDHFKETFRYIFMNDAAGDPYALALGLSLIEPLAIGLKDPSFIHHALLELEGHFSLGKEWVVGDRWEYRNFAVFALGVGVQGSPWLKARGVFQKNFCDQHFLSFELLGEGGFGHRDFSLCKFKGYGPIAYRIGETLLAYTYQGETGWTASLQATYRFFAKNAPANVAVIQAEIVYPFSF